VIESTDASASTAVAEPTPTTIVDTNTNDAATARLTNCE